MLGQTARRVFRVALVLVLTAELSGCVSVSTTRSKAADPGAAAGNLEVAVYDNPERARVGQATASTMSLELGRLDGDRETRLQTASGSTWSFDSLEPAKYRLHLKPGSPRASGEPAPAPTITEESIKVAAGETVRTEVILKKFPTTAVVISGVVVAAGIALAVFANSWNHGWSNLRLSRNPRVSRPAKTH